MKTQGITIYINFLIMSVLLSIQSCETIDDGACPACPVISQIIPDHGRTGDEITIIGSNFEDFIEGVDKVTINNVEALLTAPPVENELKILVPPRVGNGEVVVTIGNLSSNELDKPPVLFNYDIVKIDSVRPEQAGKGEVVTIYGNFFSVVAEENTVVFSNGSEADVLKAEIELLEVIVPDRAGSGNINVTTDGFTATGGTFFYLPKAIVSTYAGVHFKQGGLNGSVEVARFSLPWYIYIDDLDNIYVTDNNGIRRIDPGGNVTTFSVDNVQIKGFTFLEDRIFISDFNSNKILEVIGNIAAGFTTKPYIDTAFIQPHGIVFDGEANLYVAEKFNNKILKITPDLEVTVFAGSGEEGGLDGVGESAQFSFPNNVFIDHQQNIIVTEENHRIRSISPNGVVTTIAGGTFGFQNGVGTEARFKTPRGVVCDTEGNLYVADAFNNSIRKIAPNGLVSLLAGNPFVVSNGPVDGPGEDARFLEPNGIAIDSNGDLFVTDNGYHLIRKITLE